MNGKAGVGDLASNSFWPWLGFFAKALLPVGLFAVSIVSATAQRAQAMPAVAVADQAPGATSRVGVRGDAPTLNPTGTVRARSQAAPASTIVSSSEEQES